MDIRNSVAVVTGAGSGIGRAVSLELARRGAKMLALVDLSDQAVETAKCVDAISPTIAQTFRGDVTDGGFRKSVFDAVCDQFGPPRICVPAAGIARDAIAVKVNKETGECEIYPEELFRTVVEVDMIAPVYWGLEMLARIAKSRFERGLKRWAAEEAVQGVVVFIGSISSVGIKGQVAYSASKAGLEGAAATLTKEANYFGVRYGVIHPGFTDTPMVRALGEEYIRKNILPGTQLGRLIRPEEIADAICFMISNSAVTGELWADAGWHPSAA
ncbi:MAG: SDR family oxidoreductase [Acidobacteriaceae bacterium]|nr:SDR family oxidoreductase [Acidobacteriaceae bacterium]